MRLTDLSPQWIMNGGSRIGFIFRCPLEPGNARRWQTCFFYPTPTKLQWQCVKELGATMFLGGDKWGAVQFCKPETAWTCQGVTPDLATFETMTVTPSLDGSQGGNWHGFITNGEIVGGL